MNSLKHQRCHNNMAGYTLLEVLIAVAILSIGILAVASMQISATSGNVSSQTVSDLTYVAAMQMEHIISQPYASIVTNLNPTVTADWIDNDDDGDVDEAGETATRYSSSWTVANDAVLNDTRTVSLTVTDGWRNRNRQITLTNIVALGQR